jgi:hypothetical protein
MSATLHAVLAVIVAQGAPRAASGSVEHRAVPPPRLVAASLPPPATKHVGKGGPTEPPHPSSLRASPSSRVNASGSPATVMPSRPAEPRPIAVATLGVSSLMLACGLTLVAIGIESRRLAPDADTEGAAVGRDSGALRLLATGIPVASVGLIGVVGGIVWVVKERRGARRAGAR